MNELRKIIPTDLLNLQVIGDPQISPDGERVVFSLKTIDQEQNHYRSALWLLEIESGETRTLSSSQNGGSMPRWSPDGARIAFVRGDGAADQIWLYEIASQSETCLTRLPEGSIAALCWSPAGDRLAFTFAAVDPAYSQAALQQRESRNLSAAPRLVDRLRYRLEGRGYLDTITHLWICQVSDGAVVQLTDGNFDVWAPVWSPDSSRIAFLANQSATPDAEPFLQDIWLISSEGGLPGKVAGSPGYKDDLIWSVDGRDLAYAGTHTEADPWAARSDGLWLQPAAGGPARCLTTALDRPLENATVSDARGGGSRLVQSAAGRFFFLISDRGSCHLYAASAGQPPLRLVGGALDIAAVSSDAAGQRLVLLVSTPTRPAELFLCDPGSAQLQPLTEFNRRWLDGLTLSEPASLSIPTSDGQTIDGWLLSPSDHRPGARVPLLLAIHGGPDAQYGATFMFEFQCLAAQGMHVLYTNPRGSLGYGEAFANAIRGHWGSLDYQDLMAAVDLAAELPEVDRQRLAVAGGSYGGFMTAWIVAHSRRFCCAIAERGTYNRHSAAGTSDFPPMPDGYWPGNAWDRPERLWEQSPLKYAAKIHTPLLLLQAEGDWRCPIEQAEQLFTALKRLGRPVLLVRYPPPANHSFSRDGPPDLRLDRLERMIGWLNQHFA